MFNIYTGEYEIQRIKITAKVSDGSYFDELLNENVITVTTSCFYDF